MLLLIVPAAVLAQVAPAAVGGNSSLWAGGEISSFNPDYSCSSSVPFECKSQLIGPAAFFDFNVTPKWGAEGEARWLHWNGPGGEIESNYLAGGRYRAYRYHRLDAWAKMLAGAGLITTPDYPCGRQPERQLLRPRSRRNPRAAHDAIASPCAAITSTSSGPLSLGPPTYDLSTGALVQHNSGLTPNGFSLGVSYRFLGILTPELPPGPALSRL